MDNDWIISKILEEEREEVQQQQIQLELPLFIDPEMIPIIIANENNEENNKRGVEIIQL